MRQIPMRGVNDGAASSAPPGQQGRQKRFAVVRMEQIDLALDQPIGQFADIAAIDQRISFWQGEKLDSGFRAAVFQRGRGGRGDGGHDRPPAVQGREPDRQVQHMALGAGKYIGIGQQESAHSSGEPPLDESACCARIWE
jgi:hypothetical protein